MLEIALDILQIAVDTLEIALAFWPTKRPTPLLTHMICILSQRLSSFLFISGFCPWFFLHFCFRCLRCCCSTARSTSEQLGLQRVVVVSRRLQTSLIKDPGTWGLVGGQLDWEEVLVKFVLLGRKGWKGGKEGKGEKAMFFQSNTRGKGGSFHGGMAWSCPASCETSSSIFADVWFFKSLEVSWLPPIQQCQWCIYHSERVGDKLRSRVLRRAALRMGSQVRRGWHHNCSIAATWSVEGILHNFRLFQVQTTAPKSTPKLAKSIPFWLPRRSFGGAERSVPCRGVMMEIQLSCGRVRRGGTFSKHL